MNELWAALALVMILEGIYPFLHPRGWRDNLRAIFELDDRTLRVIGFFSMMLGLLLLYMVRSHAPN